MDIRKVIQIILSYIPTEKLKQLRLICYSWNIEACKLLQTREIVEFHHVTDISRYLTTFSRKNVSLSPQKEFPYPYARFCFHKVRLNLIHDTYLLRSFFKKYANTISYIQMDFTGPQFRLKCLRMCVLEHIWNTNVKTMIFNFKEFYEVWPASLTDDDTKSFSASDSVQDLTIYGFGKESTLKSLLTKILPYFNNVVRIEAGEQIGRLIFDIVYGKGAPETRQSSPLTNLKKLEFNSIFPTQIDSIIKQGVRLSFLAGEFHMCNEDQIKALLGHLSSTLEELVVDSHGKMTFPPPSCQMARLVKLEIRKFHLDLSTLSLFPMMRKLNLKMVHFSCSNALVRDSPGNKNMLSLTLELCELNSRIVTEFSKLFPWLRKVDLPFYNFEVNLQLLAQLCLEMERLREIHLSVCEDSPERVRCALAEVFGGDKVSSMEGESNTNTLATRVVQVFNRETQNIICHLRI